MLVVGLALGGMALLTALVPTLPKPSGPHSVGSVIFRWTDNKRSETLTADPSDRRQVIAQAWYPTDATTGQAVPYFEAQGHLPSSISGLPSFMFASFGSVATHATAAAPVSAAQRTWPVLLFSPGLSIPREQYTALCADLASRGYVVVALSVPYESSVSVLAGGRVVGQTIHPDVMGPPPHPALERLIDIRAADSRFVLDQLGRLAQLEPGSPLAGHLDLQHVGIVGHSIGGATAVQVMASDPRFRVGVNLDGKLFGTEPDARLNRPFLWIQSGGSQTTEYTSGRDRFLARQRDGGTLLTIRKSVHMGFTDDPSYLTSLGRSLIGATDRRWFDFARRHDVDDRGHDLRLRRPGAWRQERTQPRRGRCQSPGYPVGVSRRARDDCASLFADGRARSAGSHGRVPRRDAVDRADRSRPARARGARSSRGRW